MASQLATERVASESATSFETSLSSLRRMISRPKNQNIHLHPALTIVRNPGLLARVGLTLNPTSEKSEVQ